MVQIAFLTLFLGLASGSHPVDLAVSGPVAAVELLLDGAPVGTLTGPPWRRQIDLGSELVPHELVARALDATGAEIARARQWLNLPRPPAEVKLVFEGQGPAGPTAVRLGWETIVAVKPSQVSLTLDGQPLALDAQRRAALPRYDPEVPHVLSAEMELGPGVTARRDVVLGAGGGEAFGELTAIPVRGDPPAPERMQGWFTAGGAPLRPVAVERPAGQVVIVRDMGARALLTAIAGVPTVAVARPGSTLGRNDRVRFLLPRPRSKVSSSGIPVELFDLSPPFTSKDGGLHYLLSRISTPNERPIGQRLADAVAVAGLMALAGNQPRAVVLVLGRDPVDESFYDPAVVRRFLAALRVPLHVWSLVPPASSPAAAAWAGAEDVSSRGRLMRAIEGLRRELASSRMVFLEGLHLPQAIRLTPAATGLELP